MVSGSVKITAFLRFLPVIILAGQIQHHLLSRKPKDGAENPQRTIGLWEACEKPLSSLRCGCFRASYLPTGVGVRGRFEGVFAHAWIFVFSVCQQPGRGCSITNKMHHLTTETSKINMEWRGQNSGGRCRRRGGRKGWLQPGVVMSTVLSGSRGCVVQSDASRGMQCHVRRRRRRRTGRVLAKNALGLMRVG